MTDNSLPAPEIDAKHVKEQQVMAEIDKNYQYLSAHPNMQCVNIVDFQGNRHLTAENYLVAVGKDYTINDCIDYTSKLGQAIKSSLEDELKLDLPDRDLAGLKAIAAQPEAQTFATEQESLARTDQRTFDVTTEMDSKYYYLKRQQAEHGDKSHKIDSVKDFQGVEHTDAASFIEAVARDHSVNKSIHYGTPIATEMKSVLEEKMQVELPERCFVGVKELVQSQQVEVKSELTQREVMFDIEQKHDYLCAHWRDYIGSKNDDFGVKDFQGMVHRSPPSYLTAVGQDPTVYDKIDYSTEVAHEMKKYLECRLDRDLPERCLADLNAHGQDLTKSYSMSRGMGFGLGD